MLSEPTNIPGNFIIDAIGESLFGIDKNGNCIFINTAAAKMLGYNREDMLGMNMHSLIHGKHINQQAHPLAECPILKVMTPAADSTVENDRFWKSDGTSIDVSYTANPIFENDILKGVVVTFKDISLQKKREAAEKHSKNNQEYLINSTDDLIWSVDRDLHIITANRPYLDMIKMVAAKNIQEGDSVLVEEFGEELNNRWKDYYKKAFKGERFTIKEQVFNPLKQSMEYGQVSFNPMYNAEGDLFGLACYSKNITEETIGFLALEAAKNELDKIMYSSIDMICTVDENGHFLKVSAASEIILGYRPDELIGKSIMDFVHPEDQKKTQQLAERVMAGNGPANIENRYVRKDGALVSLSWSAVWNAKDRVRYGVARDVTEKKRAEDQLKQSEADLAEAQRLAKMGSWHFDFKADRLTWSEELYNVFGANKKTFMETHGSFVNLVNVEDREKVLRTSRHTQQTGDPFTIEYHITTPANEHRVIQEHGYGEKDENGMVTRLFGTAQDITERKIAEEAIKKSEEKYKYLFENSPVALVIWDFETLQIVDCNKEAEILYGYNRDEFLQLTITEIRPAEDVKLIEASVKTEDSYGLIHKKVWRHNKKNGEQMYINVTGHLINYNERRVSLALLEDVTESRYYHEQEVLEKTILETKASNEKTLNEIIEMYLRGIEALHPGMLCSLQLLKADKLYNAVSPSLPAAFLDAVEGCRIGENAGSCGTAAFLKQKVIVTNVQTDERWVDYKAIAGQYGLKACWSQAILDANGHVTATFACYFREVKSPSKFEENTIERAVNLLQVILESDQREKALQISNERFEYATEATSDIIWDWNLETNGVYYSGNMYKLFGHKPGINYDNLPFYYNHVHPEDRDRVVLYPDAVKNGTFIHWTKEYRFRKADGEYAFVLDKGIVLRDGNGKGVRMVGAMQDITKQKNEERALEESEKRYSELFHLSPQPMWVYDFDSMQFLDVNKAAIKHYGYSRKEFLSMTIKNIRPPSEVIKLTETVESNKKAGLKSFQGVFTHQKKNGEIIQVEIQSNIILRKGRKAKVVLANDVTERLNYIRAIEAQNEKLKEISWIQSHIVRAPLARIMGLIPLLGDAENQEENEKMLQSILLSANELDSVIGNITDKTKITDI